MRAFILLLFTVAACGATVDQVLVKMDQAAAGFRGITATVKTTSFTAVIKDTTVETGKITLFRPKPKDVRMLVRFDRPDERSISFSGKKLQVFYPKIKTVQEYDLGKQSSLLEQFLLLGFGTPGSELRKSYDIKLLGDEDLNGAKTYHMEMIPRNEEARTHVRAVEIWISDSTAQPVQQKILMPSKDYKLITYSDIQVNPAGLNAASVQMTLPKDVKRESPQK